MAGSTAVVVNTVAGSIRVEAEAPEGWRGGDVVILWGWYGASFRALRKYAELHRADGRASVMAIAPAPAVALKLTGPLRRVAEATLDVAEALLRPVPPARQGRVHLHVFSNGGCFVYEQLLCTPALLARARRVGRGLGAAVFDSCPAYMHPETGLDVIGAHTKNPTVRALVLGTFRAWVACARAARACAGGRTPATAFWERMLGDASGIPALYIYSSGDAVTDPRALEELIAARAARAPDGAQPIAQVRAVDFGLGSAHVLHLRTDRERYVAEVRAAYKLAGDDEVGRADAPPATAPPSTRRRGMAWRVPMRRHRRGGAD